MDAAVDAVLTPKSRRSPAAPGPAPFLMPHAEHHAATVGVSEEGIACTKAGLQLHPRDLPALSGQHRCDASDVVYAGPPHRHRLLRSLLPRGRLRTDSRGAHGNVASVMLPGYRHPRHSASPRPIIHSRSSAERKSSSSVKWVTVCR